MIVSLVAAAAENNAIGKDNELLWHLPTDLKHFKNITSGHAIIMGRKTFDSVGKPLPNRRNIVITRQKNLHVEGVEFVNSLPEALSLDFSEEEVYVVGGAEIYKQAIEIADKIYLTRVYASYDGDAFFPEIEADSWTETDIDRREPDERHAVAYTFSTWLRK